MAGFNAMFAVSSIPMAMKYYTEFKRQIAESCRLAGGERLHQFVTVY